VCGALGKPEWQTDPRFTTRHERSKHAAAVNEAMRGLLAPLTMKDAIAHFKKHDVVAAPVNTIAQALEDEQVRARDMLLEVKHPQFGVLREVASPVKTAGAVSSPSPAPALGQHTDELLTELGLADRIPELRESGAVG
jgi:crotonobetainyl-CoA:carnitine CoA-transferase CaiB-like acyl-CoA transferase